MTLPKQVCREEEERQAFNPPRKVPPAPYVDPVFRAEKEYEQWLYSSPEERKERDRR